MYAGQSLQYYRYASIESNKQIDRRKYCIYADGCGYFGNFRFTRVTTNIKKTHEGSYRYFCFSKSALKKTILRQRKKIKTCDETRSDMFGYGQMHCNSGITNSTKRISGQSA